MKPILALFLVLSALVGAYTEILAGVGIATVLLGAILLIIHWRLNR